jgi:hypothetical protein
LVFFGLCLFSFVSCPFFCLVFGQFTLEGRHQWKASFQNKNVNKQLKINK